MSDFEIQGGVLVWYKGEEDIVEIPREVTRIGIGAFQDSELIRVILHDHITRIHRSAFRSCYRLQEIDIPDSVNRIDRYAFSNCTALHSVRLPRNLDRIREGTFEECASLEKIVIPDSVHIIGPAAFRECTSLKTVDLPESLEEIRDVAFQGCQVLELGALPMQLKRLDVMAFDGCNKINTLRMGDELTLFSDLSLPSSVKTLIVSERSIEKYERLLNEPKSELSNQRHCLLIGRGRGWIRNPDGLQRQSVYVQTKMGCELHI